MDGNGYYSSNLQGLQYNQIIVNNQDISMYPTGSRAVQIEGSTSHLITFTTDYGISARTVQFLTSYGTAYMSWRVSTDNRINNTWATFIDTRNYINYIKNDFVLKAGDTMTGTLMAPTLWATSTLRSNLLLTVGASNNIIAANRAELHLITPSNNPCDLWMGANNSRRWSITARPSGENYQLGIYNNNASNWNAFFRDNANELTVKTEIRDVFLVIPDKAGGSYNEGIRVANGTNNWSNIQFGSSRSWSGFQSGQWVVGKNPSNCFQICIAGTETSTTVRPSKGFSIDTNGNLHAAYIETAINPDNQGDYFYSSDDTFLRRTSWYAALSHLSNKQRTLDLTSLDQNKWYPCVINTPAYGGTPLRITLFNGLRGNKPSWASHQQGFSLLLDYEVIGSGWGTLAAVAKLNWYWGSYGGETAFGGRQQNSMASTEVIYLRGGGLYYYRTTNGSSIDVQPNGYSWVNGSYSYSAPVKTSQDNSPMERTFDQVYWLPATLRETRTFWGQPFNGSQNVSGALSGVTTINASGVIYSGADIVCQGYMYANGRLYVDRNRFSSTATPSISLAIGDTDTGLHWVSDGVVDLYANAAAVGGWTGSQFRYGHGYFKNATGNDYSTLGIMVNGNGTANTIKPGIGFHQPGIYAGSIRMNDGSTFGIYTQGGSGLANLSLNGWYTNYGYINGDGIYLTHGWFRAHGATGWYNQTYGGGMYMSDTVYVRTYNNKRLRAEKLALGDRDNDINARYITCYGMADVSYINFGYTPTGGNCGELSFAYTGSAGPSNYIGLGFYGGSGANLKMYYNRSSILIGNFTVNGNISATGGITAKTSSDIRLKNILNRKNYKDLILDLGLAETYSYNELAKNRKESHSPEGWHIGLMYHKVKPFMPQITGECSDGYGYINYHDSDLQGLVVGALQLSILDIKDLYKKHKTVYEKLEDALKRIEQLEKRLGN